MTEPTNDVLRTVARNATRKDEIERAVIAHSFALMPTSMVGVAVTASMFAFGAVGTFRDPRLWSWMSLQTIVLIVNLAVLRGYRRGRFDGTIERARSFQRLGVLLAGIAWGVAGILWPLDDRFGPGFALLFCYAGMCAGGATTLAGDPVAYGLFASSSLLPYAMQSFPSLWWLSSLLAAFITITSTTVVWNERTLRESLALRFENIDLLRSAIREREAAIDARSDAERAAQAKSRFIAAASHDLRQPVQALSLFVDVLQHGAASDPGRRARAIDSLARTTDALRETIEGLLDLSRLDSGLVSSSPTAVPLRPVLEEVVAALRDESDARGVLVLSAGRTSTVLADPVLLSRVLHNLAANAVRHAARGRVVIATRRHAAYATVQVWDQGPGIPEADRDRIFDEFVQLGNSERDRRKGLGLGLPIVRRICDQNGWTLTLRSTTGRGTMFSVTFPLDRSEPSGLVSVPRLPTSEAYSVVFVEDDVLVAEAGTAFLEARGCAVYAASSAVDAESLIERLRLDGVVLDVLVTDLRLPGGIDGLELVRRVSTEPGGASPWPRLAAILVTGDADSAAGHGPIPNGIPVLRKPVSGEALWDAITRSRPLPNRATGDQRGT